MFVMVGPVWVWGYSPKAGTSTTSVYKAIPGQDTSLIGFHPLPSLIMMQRFVGHHWAKTSMSGFATRIHFES
jgi:hypothetical protein